MSDYLPIFGSLSGCVFAVGDGMVCDGKMERGQASGAKKKPNTRLVNPTKSGSGVWFFLSTTSGGFLLFDRGLMWEAGQDRNLGISGDYWIEMNQQGSPYRRF